MKLNALKMQGAGNDFIIIDNRETGFDNSRLSALAAKLCQRRVSVGADGLMAVSESSKADFAMTYFNSDGSLGEMCGNGARCICRYGYEKGLSGSEPAVETTSGIVKGLRLDEKNYRIRLNEPTAFIKEVPVEIDGTAYEVSYAELGNPGLPHALVHLEGFLDMERSELFTLGKRIRFWHSFPKGANVTFYSIKGDNALDAVTYERGVEDFTLACGTGAGSLALAAYKKGYTSGVDTKIMMPGGTLSVTLGEENGEVKDIFLTGPTEIVAEIVIDNL